MRRVHPGSDRSQIHVGELDVDVRGRRATLAGESLALTTKEFDLHVASLRKKLGDPAWIETVRGIGLRLVPQP